MPTIPSSTARKQFGLLRLALSIDDGDPDTLARASVISAFMVGDSEAEIEMADRAVALNPNSWSHGTAEAGSIELRGCRRKRSGALNVPFA